MAVHFEIPGRPVAKQRARQRNGQFYTPAATRHFEDAVALIARADRGPQLTGEIEVEIHISTKRPMRGDVDNYAKSILDGIVKGGVIADDREIVSLCISKSVVTWEDDRTYVSVRQRSET